MPRPRAHAPLRVHLNRTLVGHLQRQSDGAITFAYAAEWLDGPIAFAISLSLPLREDVYRGGPVLAVFDNLLPDSDGLRRRVAEKVGARGTDAFSLLSVIGRDCVGALQFIPGDDPEEAAVTGGAEPVDEDGIERILRNLAQAPLGLDREDPFRISVAGAQEKTALLLKDGQWFRPYGTTPTTHLFKTQIGHLPNGIDLTNSVDNEFYCLAFFRAFGLDVARAEIATFGRTKALVVERFDRRKGSDGTTLRLPQEDFCQALGIPPTMKYQNAGGPGVADCLDLLRRSSRPDEDRDAFMQSVLLFWILGATDGHAKNFSIFLTPSGASMTPIYDVLTVEPALSAGQISRRQMTLAMGVGNNRHYRFDKIQPRHFLQSFASALGSDYRPKRVLVDFAERVRGAFERIEDLLPEGFDGSIHGVVKAAAGPRLRALDLWDGRP